MNALSEAIYNQTNQTTTQNGALAFKSTGDKNLDFFSRAGALRNSQEQMLDLFKRAFAESPEAAIVLAFALRDVRGGGKEKQSFKTILTWLYKNHQDYFNKVVKLVPEYGYWKDIISFVDSDVVINMVSVQLAKDALSRNPSLLAKWMPSVNAGKSARKLALQWIKALQIDGEAEYRRGLSAIRSNIKTVESYMSANEWELIEYSKVPSVAMKRNGSAFAKHDHARFDAFLKAAVKGEVEIKATTLLPHEIANVYVKSIGYVNRRGDVYRGNFSEPLNLVAEAQWKALEDYTNDKNVLVMPDVSSSMKTEGFGKATALSVSVSLAVYFAQRSKGAFKDQIVTFSDAPKFIQLDNTSLRSALLSVFSHCQMGNTNLMASVEAILHMARKNNVSQADMPTQLLILSDMQFDCTGSMTNFEAMKRKFASSGYNMPEVVFWNLNSSIKQNSPVKKNEYGVALVSGASPANLMYVLNSKVVSPIETMLLVLNAERYAPVREALV